jgi:hypothetical protein
MMIDPMHVLLIVGVFLLVVASMTGLIMSELIPVAAQLFAVLLIVQVFLIYLSLLFDVLHWCACSTYVSYNVSCKL